ncbi:hypothetical protein MMYC01_206263 [Madurella mycetomatis]|uniref:Uncharacterized protein n=1 Tax=Madurella mycetomatis TaxID=100816 RepID=A0A175VXP3_9PEZI|nr:hypothetical protein MMYC01_206263 [Madurella mycetomatis]
MPSIDGSGGLSRRRLRAASMRRRPGRHQEDDGPITADRPIFAHPDVAFRADLSAHCAFPSLPFDYPGPGPSEIWKTQRAIIETAATGASEENGHDAGSSEGTDDEERGEGSMLITPSIDGDREDGDDWRPASRGRLPVAVELGESERGDGTDPEETEEMVSEGEANGESEVALNEQSEPPKAVAITLLSASPMDHLQGLQQATHGHPPRHPHAVMALEGKAHESVEQNTTHTNDAANDGHRAPGFLPVGRNWAELSPGIQYAIVHELIQDGTSFTRAVKELGLSFGEAVALIEMAGKEKLKKQRYKEAIREHANSVDLSWLGDFVRAPGLAPVNDTITADEVRQGREFLAFMGLSHLAAKLEDYHGTGGDFLSIPINHLVEDGWRGLFPHFNVLCGEEIQQMLDAEKAEGRRRPPAMSRSEMFVRMDPPPGTTNPRRVDHRLHVGSATDYQSGSLPMGLHPENFVVRLGSGKRYSILDPSPWPLRAALEDAGKEVDARLRALTANSEAPDFISYLSVEDIAAMQSLSPAMAKERAITPHPVENASTGEHGKADVPEEQALLEECASDGCAAAVPGMNPLGELAPGQQELGETELADRGELARKPGEQSATQSERVRYELHRFLANDRVFLTGAPSVQGRDQELEVSVNSILARYTRNARFDDDEFIEDLDPPRYYPNGRQKQRYPGAEDDEDDDWKPGRPGRRSRAPRTAPETQNFVVGSDGTLLEQPRRRCGRPPKRPRPTPASFGPASELGTPRDLERFQHRITPPTVSPHPSASQSARQPGLYNAVPLASFPTLSEALGADIQPAGRRLDQHGQSVKGAGSRRKTDGETGEDNKRRRHYRANRSSVDPSCRMQSTEGVVLTRAEFDQAYRPEEWKYYPGGRNGGGRFEILATGVMWQFLPRDGESEKGEAQSRKRPRSENGASEAGKRRHKALTKSATPEQNLAGHQHIPPPNANANAAIPDLTGCAAPAVSVGNPTQASRLDQRLRQMGLPTRSTFESDNAFRSFLSGIPSVWLVDTCHVHAGDDSEDPFGVDRPVGCG